MSHSSSHHTREGITEKGSKPEGFSNPPNEASDRLQLMDKAAFLDFTIKMIRWRQLVKGYEQRIDVTEAMIHIAIGNPCYAETLIRELPKGLLKNDIRTKPSEDLQLFITHGKPFVMHFTNFFYFFLIFPTLKLTRPI
ncbi:hypothetical protein AD948_00950 [Acetobacter senegalensis]|uniref:Uncharacterized protein n=1 Tax=Acetobacter senegalensis TaxID=446692 RepID=A0A149U8Q1_9PROT|nr:hypothetical protein AD948_00950 [Acetobacter senegalensis]